MILAADIGGTNARLGLFELDGGRLRLAAAETYPSREHASLDDIVRLFVATHPKPIERACLAVAGPVTERRVVATNLAWIVDAERLAGVLGLDTIGLINDLEAIALGLDELAPSDIVLLHSGRAGAEGNRAIIAAGTGLGEAGAYWDGRTHHPFASEGGHADFGPRSQLEVDLLGFLLAKYDRVSYERVLSGPGLAEIYRFLRDFGHGVEPPWLTKELADEPAPIVIVRAAVDGRSELCQGAVSLFASVYGAEAGNLALKLMARGGVWIAGGIAPRLLPWMKAPGFLDAFLAKGRMRSLVEAMPVRLITNDRAGLLGAGRWAIRN